MAVPITFQPAGRSIEVESGDTLWTAAIRANLPLPSICGGQGICGKCRVKVLRGKVSEATAAERDALTPDELESGYRLACETVPLASVVIKTPLVHEDRRSKVKLLELSGEVDISPGVSKLYIQMPFPTLDDARSDAERLATTVAGFGYDPPEIEIPILRTLPRVLREDDFHVTVTRCGDRVLDVQPGDTTDAFFGLAIDLGTTTVAAYLMDLASGEKVAAAATANRQAVFGDDVMSRLSYAMSEGTHQLRQTAVEVINELIHTVCEAAGVSPNAVYAMTVTGNTTMLHFLAGLPTQHLGVAPYVAVNYEQRRSTAAALELAIHPRAPVWLLPGVGAYAGADAVSGALAAGWLESEQLRLFVDFGTNAEILLGSRHQTWACATAAGPAFEGARIKHGMRAAPGAIDRVWVDDGRVSVGTIDRKRPLGVAGTGLVSAVAALRSVGVLDDRGLFCQHRRLPSEAWVPASDGKGVELLLVKPTRTREAITLTQADIGEFQLAKAAVRAGIEILLDKAGFVSSDIEQILLAGAFGSFMDPGDALAADLLPAVPVEQIRSIGNAAGLGAAIALLSSEKRKQGRELARAINYVELSAEPRFNRLFARALPFRK